MSQITEDIRIEGMSCGGCVAGVRKALEGTEGVSVEEVRVGAARVRYDAARTDRSAIAEAIKEAGFRPRFEAT